MNSTPSHRRSLVILNLVAVLALTGAGVAAATDALVSPNGVELRPYRGYESAALRVTGPDGLVIEQVFEGSTSIWLPLLDEAGSALPDGQYTWSLTLTPALSPKVKEQLRQARESGDDSVVLELRASGALPDPADMVSSGSLKVTGGAFVVPSADVEEQVRATGETVAKSGVDDQDVPTRDQVIVDDLIVDGSACIGVDCVNGESFGFDTIRLKENNLRIKFDDTSSSASFPNVDWQLTANDSASGGANKFSIDDITNSRTPFTIEAAAPSNSLYVDNGGRVGFGTASPVVELHVVNGDSPTLRLEQNGSSGFAPQTWDIAGNETNFFVRDLTNGSALPFRIRPGADSNSLFIDVDNDVGFGTASPKARVHKLTSGTVFDPAFDIDMMVQRNGSPSDFAAISLISGTGSNAQINFGDSTSISQGRIIYDMTSDELRFFANGTKYVTLQSDGDLQVTGSIITGGPTCSSGCDAVFKPGFEVESIESHASEMWANGYLPAVGPTEPKAPINISETTGRILNELEKAHIYIEQLNSRIKVLEESLLAAQAQSDS